MGVNMVTDARILAQVLTDPHRRHPVVVISQAAYSPHTRLNAQALADQVGAHALVYQIANGPLTFELETLLPARSNVFGNAGRVYRPSTDFAQDAGYFPPRIARSVAEISATVDALVRDVRQCPDPAPQAVQPHPASIPGPGPRPASRSSRTGPPTPPEPAGPVTATVQSIDATGTQALVRFDQTRIGVIEQRNLLPGYPLNWFLTEGQAITCVLGEDRVTADLRPFLRVPDLTAVYTPGDMVLALVTEITDSAAGLQLLPTQKPFKTPAEALTDPDTALTEALRLGQVITVIYRRQMGAVKLVRPHPGEDLQAVLAPPVIEGGCPWLVPGRHHPAHYPGAPPSASSAGSPAELGEGLGEHAETPPRDDTDPSAETPTPVPHGHKADNAIAHPTHDSPSTSFASVVEELHHQIESQAESITELTAELADIQRQKKELRKQRDALDTKLRRLEKALKQTNNQSHARDQDFPGSAFDLVRYEIFWTWSTHIPDAEKPQLPAPYNYLIGADFPDSLDAHTEKNFRSKALEIIVDLLTGRSATRARLNTHPLRQGSGPQNPPVVRSDGATAYRVYLQQKTPAARRLHYWVLPDHRIELSRVVRHDDYKA